MPPVRRDGVWAFFSTIPNHVWVPVIIAYACLLPREMTIEIAGAALFPYRACLFIFLPIVLGQIRHVPRVSFIDFVAAFTAIWHLVALLTTETMTTAIVRGVAQGGDFGLAYLIGRLTLRNPNDLRTFFVAIVPALGLTAVVMAAEALSGRMILRPFVAQLFGQVNPSSFYEGYRLGLFRASGPFPHPILGGVFLATTLPLAWYLPRNRTVKVIAVIAALCCIFTVSSTSVLALGLCMVIMGMAWLQNVTRLPIFTTVIAYFFIGYVAVSAVSESGPLSVASRYLLFDATSSYYRQLIWEYASAEALNHPVFGIGLRDWERPAWMGASVDSFWLLSAMMFGFPMAVGAFLTLAGSISLMAKRCGRAPWEVRRAALALGTLLAVIIFSGFTVHLWEGVACWMLMMCGAGMTLSQWRDQIAPQHRQMRPPMQRPPMPRPPMQRPAMQRPPLPRPPHPAHNRAQRPTITPQARNP
jgi:hypothetical protein